MAAERLRKLDVIVVTVYKVQHPLAQSGAVLRQGKLQHRQQHEYPRRRAALPSLHAYPSPSVTNIFRWGQAYDSNFFLTIYSLVIIIRWLSEKSILRGVAQLVARLVRDQEAGSSSLPTPTKLKREPEFTELRFFFIFIDFSRDFGVSVFLRRSPPLTVIVHCKPHLSSQITCELLAHSPSVQLMQPLNVRHIADHALMFPVVHGFHALRRLPVSAAVILYQAYRFGV